MTLMIKNLSIKSRLTSVIGFLSILLALIGAVGLVGLRQTYQDVQVMYENNMLSMIKLGEMTDSLSTSRHRALSSALVGASADSEKSLALLNEAQKNGAKIWSEYLERPLTAQEKSLADQFGAQYEKLDVEGIQRVIEAVNDLNFNQTNKLFAGPVPVLFDTAANTLNELTQLQKSAGKLRFEQTQERYNNLLLLTSLTLLFGLPIALAAGVWLVRAISEPLNRAVTAAQAVAEGDLTQSIEVHSTDETGQLMTALSVMNTRLQQIVGQVRESTDTIVTASAEIAQGNLDLSSRTEMQASSLEETASAMEELTSTVKRNADSARQASQLASAASQTATGCGALVTEVVDTMREIKNSSEKIVDIIGVINDIAFQTNILALNAAVEAARAGEQGRGFSVVASEVRSLAQRSADAAKEIKTLIDDSSQKVGKGSALVVRAGAVMSEVVTSVKRVSTVVGEITTSSNEQSVGIEEVNRAISQMDQTTQQNAALVEEAAAAAQSLHDQAERLTEVVGVFKLGNSSDSTASKGGGAAPRNQPHDDLESN